MLHYFEGTAVVCSWAAYGTGPLDKNGFAFEQCPPVHIRGGPTGVLSGGQATPLARSGEEGSPRSLGK